jgi:hypothetical protein
VHISLLRGRIFCTFLHIFYLHGCIFHSLPCRRRDIIFFIFLHIPYPYIHTLLQSSHLYGSIFHLLLHKITCSSIFHTLLFISCLRGGIFHTYLHISNLQYSLFTLSAYLSVAWRHILLLSAYFSLAYQHISHLPAYLSPVWQCTVFHPCSSFSNLRANFYSMFCQKETGVKGLLL